METTNKQNLEEEIISETEKIEIISKLKIFQKNTLPDEYDEGFYNGIELALSLLEKREAIYKSTVRDTLLKISKEEKYEKKRTFWWKLWKK